MAYFDILILAAVAAFLGYRLWSLLGTHDPDSPINKNSKSSLFIDEDEEPIRPTQRPQVIESEEVIQPRFNTVQFLEGAEVAFRMIVESFACGDKKALKPLLSPEVYKNFTTSIDERKKSGVTLDLELARINKAEVVEEDEVNGFKEVVVRFISEQCSVTRDAKGKIIAGDPEQFHEVIDVWTFSRKLDSSNPNWTLVSTESE